MNNQHRSDIFDTNTQNRGREKLSEKTLPFSDNDKGQKEQKETSQGKDRP